jgi:hypothetical protein
MGRHMVNKFVNPSGTSRSLVELVCIMIVYIKRNSSESRASLGSLDTSVCDAALYDEIRSGSFRKTKEPCLLLT